MISESPWCNGRYDAANVASRSQLNTRMKRRKPPIPYAHIFNILGIAPPAQRPPHARLESEIPTYVPSSVSGDELDRSRARSMLSARAASDAIIAEPVRPLTFTAPGATPVLYADLSQRATLVANCECLRATPSRGRGAPQALSPQCLPEC